MCILTLEVCFKWSSAREISSEGNFSPSNILAFRSPLAENNTEAFRDEWMNEWNVYSLKSYNFYKWELHWLSWNTCYLYFLMSVHVQLNVNVKCQFFFYFFWPFLLLFFTSLSIACGPPVNDHASTSCHFPSKSRGCSIAN